ncbi:armadillo-type protein [Fimicolochytrium jonesii]|uniref:armadillo-type protein n=1 Tax=Fimicolochytrium jonesii TaxID=1396493 RepID=UPI0022FE0307|nr:armadillo-type protein [Fimicolochytrium jonesii]KAI8822933.1 armadillo-type protein [Fimicolochytrium jonesii]
MDAGTLYQLFSATVVADDAVRKPAEEQLKKVEIAPGFLPAVLQILGSSEANESVRQAAAVFFKNRCQRGWDPSGKLALGEEDKVSIRQNILPAIVHLPHRLRVQLVACLGSMLQHDNKANRWPEYLTQAMTLVKSSDEGAVSAGVAAVFEFVKSYQWGDEEKRAPIQPIIQEGLPILYTVATHLITLNTEAAGFNLKTILRIYMSTIRLNLSPTQQSSASLVPWGTLFVQLVQKPITADFPGMPEDESERERHPWWKAKKWAYHILNLLFERYARKPEKKYQQFSAVFMEHFAPNILTAYLHQIELLIGGVWLSPRVKQLIANFLQSSIKPRSTWAILKPHLETIIMHFIFPLLSFSDEDQELWEDDPVEYLQKKVDNPMDDFRSPVSAAEALLFEVTKLRNQQTFVPTVTLINGIIQRYNESPVETRNPRHKDGALHMMACLAPLALSPKSPIKDHIETFLVHNVIPELKSPYGFLRARACNTLLTYEDVDFENVEHQQLAFRGVLDCLRDSELPVRVSGALALRPYLRVPTIHEAMKPHVQDIIQAMMSLNNEVDMESLTEVLESLVGDFSSELTPFAVQLASQLSETFLRMLAEAREVADEGDSYDMAEAFDEKTAAAQGVMRTLCTLVLAMEASQQILSELEVIIAPSLSFVLSNHLADLYQEVFEVIETLTYCAKKISPTMWQIWTVLYGAYKADASDYLEEMANTLENYIAFGSEVFATSQELQAQIFEIIHNTLGANDLNYSNTTRARACDLIELLLLHLPGHVDAMVPQFIDLILPYLAPNKAKKAPYRVRCLEVIINALYYNPGATLELLEQRNATTAFFMKWFTDLPEFRRVHDKKLCVLALSAVLELPVQQLPASLQGQAWTEMLNGVFKVFETLPVALKAREDEKALYEDGLDSEDEDDELASDDEDEDPLFRHTADDADAFDEDDEYLDLLDQKNAEKNPDYTPSATDTHLAGQPYVGDGADDDDEDEDEWDLDDLDEDIFLETPLDKIDAYVAFEGTMQRLANRADTAALLQQGVAGAQGLVQDIVTRAADFRTKEAEKAAAELQKQ